MAWTPKHLELRKAKRAAKLAEAERERMARLTKPHYGMDPWKAVGIAPQEGTK